MTNRTYFPRIIHVKGKRMEIVIGLTSFIGNTAAAKAKAAQVRASLKLDGLPYVVRRYYEQIVTYR